MGGKKQKGGRGTQQQQRRQISDERFAQCTKEQLKVECRKRGQKTTGNKTELVGFACFNRLLCFILFVYIKFLKIEVTALDTLNAMFPFFPSPSNQSFLN